MDPLQLNQDPSTPSTLFTSYLYPLLPSPSFPSFPLSFFFFVFDGKKAFLKYDGVNELSMLVPPAGVDMEHAVEGVKGSLKPATLRAGYMHVNGALEPVWDVEVWQGEKKEAKRG